MYLDMADALITDVHETLGRHRHGAHSRLGRASDDSPLLGGLRIGKEAEEDEEDGDGQYFHYLTKWMFGNAFYTYHFLLYVVLSYHYFLLFRHTL